MDLELLRTFIEVYRCRHFGKAADRLYITQSAVSARIRQLETGLGCQLLIRERKQVQPTAEGERFLQHAESLLEKWERARRDMADSSASGPPLRLGAVPVLWEVRVLDWMTTYHRSFPAVRLHAETNEAQVLMSRLLEGSLDLVFQFELPRAADTEHMTIGKVPLVLAATTPGQNFQSALENSYIAFYWGSTFAAAQSEFLTGSAAGLRMDGLHTALGWLRNNGGAVYLPEDIVSRNADLYLVEDAPRFEREAHVVWHERSQQRDMINQFLAVCETS